MTYCFQLRYYGLVIKKTLASISILLTLVISGNVSANTQPEELRQLLQLAEYVGVDYVSAVADGKVIDQGEYQEMVEFSGIILEKSTALLTDKNQIKILAQSLQAAIANKQKVDMIQDLSSDLRGLLLALSPQLSLPRSLIANSEANTMFQNNCSSCHGSSGSGDGQLAQKLNPMPTDFTDKTRARNRSVLGLYDAISGGIEGTAMPSFKHLTEKERWSLAFFVGGMAFTADDKQEISPKSALTIQDVVIFSPSELNSKRTESEWKLVETARANPALLFSNTESPLSITRLRLKEANIAYQQGDYDKAKSLAVSAYLDGFELIENSLDARDKVLRQSIESSLLNLRQQLSDRQNVNQLEQSLAKILTQLEQAEQLLTGSSLSNTALFSASFIILLREGLEALLVVIALFTVLLRSNKKEAIKYVHFGWGFALVSGVLTWLAAQHLVTISGASREIMEGVAAMLAAAVLFYVGFWMHSKTQADQWQIYIQQNIAKNLKAGTLWGISGLAFIAVYREVFETVLFYQSLLTQTAPSQEFALVGGFVFAVAVLMLITWLMVKYSVKLPISRFFSTTTYLLLALSFVLAGKAISALQEAAVIGISPLPIHFQIEWLGINSTWQGIVMQFLILLLSSLLIGKQWLKLKFGHRQSIESNG